MKATLGHGASTCSYTDWLGADLIVFFGSNTPNNQPVTTKYLLLGEAARRADRRREPVSRARAGALLGAVDRRERAVRHAPRRRLVRRAHRRRPRVPGRRAARARSRRRRRSTARSSSARPRASRPRASGRVAADWAALEAESGATRDDMRRFARLLVERPNAVLRLVDGAHPARARRRHRAGAGQRGLARGLLGRPQRGLMPIRGHSGVQGGAEVGCVPGIDATTPRHAGRASWGFASAATHGLTAAEMVDASAARRDRPLLDRRRQLPRDAGRRGANARRRWRGRRCASIRTSCSRRRCWSSRGHRAAPAGGDALRVAGRRHRDDHRAAHHLLARDSGPARRIGAARVGGVPRRDGARASRIARRRRCVSRAPPPSAPRSRARCRCTPASRRCARRATQCSGAARALRRRPLRHGRRRARVLASVPLPDAAAPAIASTSRPGAASSSTRWSSATSIRSPARARDAVLISRRRCRALGLAEARPSTGVRARRFTAAS